MIMNSVVKAAIRAGEFGHLLLRFFKFFERLHPHGFRPLKASHDLGVFFVPCGKLACFAVLIKCGIGEFLGKFVAHVIDFVDTFFGFLGLGTQAWICSRREGFLWCAALALPLSLLGLSGVSSILR